MNSILYGFFVLSLAATFAPAHARNNAAGLKDPAIKKCCLTVQNRQPWCACKSPISSDIIDLSSLGTKKTISENPRFVSKPRDGWYIAWSPCEEFDVFANDTLNPGEGEKACKGVGFARFSNTSAKICEGYGSHSAAAKFYSGGYDPVTKNEHFFIEFTFNQRSAKIRLQCTPESDENQLVYNYEKGAEEIATFHSKCCCVNTLCTKRNNHSQSKKGQQPMIIGLTVGGILFVALLAIGVRKTYKKYRPPFPIPVEAQEHDERRLLL